MALFLRKLFLFLFFVSILFWKSILEEGVGRATQFFLSSQRGWKLKYEKVEIGWKGISFSHLRLTDEKGFRLKAREGKVAPFRKHFELLGPHLLVLGGDVSSSGALDWTFSIRDGVLEGEGIEKAHFRAEKRALEERLNLWLEWERGGVTLHLTQKKEGLLSVEGTLSQFNPWFLRKWLGEDVKGAFTGEFSYGSESLSLHLEGTDVAWRDLVQGAKGVLEGEGPWDGTRYFKEGRGRLVLEEGTLKGTKGDLEGIRGEASFHAGMGAKWEFVALQEGHPFSLRGKGIFQSLSAAWFEADLKFGSAGVSFQAKKGEGWHWEAEAEGLGVGELSFFQPLLCFAGVPFADWDYAQGVVDVKARGVGFFEEWEIDSLHGKKLSVKRFPEEDFHVEDISLFYETTTGNGGFAFEGGQFSAPLFKAQGIKGVGEIEGKALASSSFLGTMFDSEVSAEVKGGLDHLCLLLHLSGKWNMNGAIEGRWEEEVFHAHLKEGDFSFLSSGKIENLEMEFSLGREGLSCFDVQGDLLFGKRFALYSPFISKEEGFDLRLTGPLWDFVRFSGKFDANEVIFDLQKSHFLGSHFEEATLNLAKQTLRLGLTIPWEAVLSTISPLSLPPRIGSIPLDGRVKVSLDYEGEKGASLAFLGEGLRWKKEPLALDFRLLQERDNWKIDRFQLADLSFSGEVFQVNQSLKIRKGKMKRGESLEVDFKGKVDADLRCECHLASLRLDLKSLAPWFSLLGPPFDKMEGILEGSGHLVWGEALESDFDVVTRNLRLGSVSLENRGPIHIYCSSERGALFRGLDLVIHSSDETLLPINCKIDLLQYDAQRKNWVMNRSHFHLPSDFLALQKRGFPFLGALQPSHDIDLLADVECSSDLSQAVISVKEGFIPFRGSLRHVQDVSLSLDGDEIKTDFSYFHQGHLLKARASANLGERVEGRLSVEDEEYPLEKGEMPLTLDWTYDKIAGVRLQAIEGVFGGVDAQFHAESSEALIGSARINCHPLSQLVPPQIAELFHDLKMGKGYELKGRLLVGD